MLLGRGSGQLTLFASPWSPPGWMKLPVDNQSRSMLRTAQPNGLDPAMQRPYAKYFSRFISAILDTPRQKLNEHFMLQSDSSRAERATYGLQ